MLEELGFVVFQAADGAEGLELFRREPVDLVLTDLHMPVMDGKTLITELLAIDPHLPVVVISGQGRIQDALEVIRLGAWDYLIKPVGSVEQLTFLIDRVLDRARLLRENQAYRTSLEELVNQRTDQLRREEERYRTLFESAHDAIVILKDERIEQVNASAKLMFGCPARQMYGHTLLDFSPLLQPDDLYSEDVYSLYRQRVLNGEPQSFAWRFCRPDGTCFDVDISLNSVSSEGAVYLQALIRDTSERRQHLEDLYRQAHYDALTGLPNRFLLNKTVDSLIENLSITGGSFCLFLVNINRLQQINDTFGHACGDELVRAVGERLATLVTFNDALSRFIGNEFMLAFTQLPSRERADEIARTILELLQPAFKIGNLELFVSAAIGVCWYPDHGENTELLLKNVEAAMHCARSQGDDAICWYGRQLSERSREFLSLENRLRRALELQQFQLHYQPQYATCDERVVGLEALLRWMPDEGQPVPPTVFIPVLEQSGMIIAVGAWVLDRVCGQLREWIDLGLEPVECSVNVSPLQFHRGDLVATIRLALQRHRIDPALLCLELTEGLLLENLEQTLDIMQELVQLGISLSIDDFGTGYSSLAYLSRLPIHELKIDRAFVSDLPHNTQGTTLVDTILGMAAGLGLRVVAEGVETVAQRDYLAARNCHRIQGYFYAKPLPADRLVAVLTDRKAKPCC